MAKLFDRNKLSLLPLGQRTHDLSLDCVLPLGQRDFSDPKLEAAAERIEFAKDS